MLDFTGLKAVYFNGTLKRSPAVSHTEGLLRASMRLMESNGVKTELIRTIDRDIAVGVQPDMTKEGWQTDEWPEIFKKVEAADIVVVCGPIWLGDNSSQTKKLIERLYAMSGLRKLTQSLAIQRSLASLNKLVVKNHIETHIQQMLDSGSDAKREQAVTELLQLYELNNIRSK